MNSPNYIHSAIVLDYFIKKQDGKYDPSSLQGVHSFLSKTKEEYENLLNKKELPTPILFNYVNDSIMGFFNIDMNEYKTKDDSCVIYMADIIAGLSLVIEELKYALSSKNPSKD